MELPDKTLCKRYFMSKQLLKKHIADVHKDEEEKLKCDQCPSIFSGKAALKIHKETKHAPDQQKGKCR